MRTLFLDIDGVLNLGGKFKPGLLEPDLVQKLNNLPSGTEVVIISMWRHYYDIEDLQSIFKRFGYAGPLRILDAEDRILGILDWVKNNKPISWAVLDDRYLPGLSNHQVQVCSMIGASDADMQKVATILNGR